MPCHGGGGDIAIWGCRYRGMWLEPEFFPPEPEFFFAGAGGEKPGVCTAIVGGYYVHMVKCVTVHQVQYHAKHCCLDDSCLEGYRILKIWILSGNWHLLNQDFLLKLAIFTVSF